MTYLQDRLHQKQFGKPKKEKSFSWLPKKSEKKIAEEKEEKLSGTDATMDRWHEEQRERATGICIFCGGKTEKFNDKTYRNSNAHLFPKRKNLFPSIKLRPENCIELCYYENSCHKNFDDHMITFEMIKSEYPSAWKIICEKTKILYPFMTMQEKNRVPEIILNEIKL